VFAKKNAVIPDSLNRFPLIRVPVKRVVATSTTHLPSLDLLGESNSLIGFPNLNYISSPNIRTRIEQGKVAELGSNQQMNTELLLNLRPDVIIGYGIDNKNTGLDLLQKSGLAVVFNGDWNEQSPLGKAEWIKFFGVLYSKEVEAEKQFNQIEKAYLATVELAKKATKKPTVLSGAMYQDQWYLPQGESWAAQFIAAAGGTYLWKDSPGSGSLALPFEAVFEKAAQADFWIGPAQFTSYQELTQSSSHYSQFKAYQQRKMATFSTKKGKTGGILYYELAPNRPDLVLQDLVKILHPELLPHYQLYFFAPLR
jgi:iron complex transport system substrate-binding protein